MKIIINHPDWNFNKVVRGVIITLWKVSELGVFPGPHFSYIQTENGDVLLWSLYSALIPENTDSKEFQIWTLFPQFIFNF